MNRESPEPKASPAGRAADGLTGRVFGWVIAALIMMVVVGVLLVLVRSLRSRPPNPDRDEPLAPSPAAATLRP